MFILFKTRAGARALIGEGCIFIYSYPAQLVSFEIKLDTFNIIVCIIISATVLQNRVYVYMYMYMYISMWYYQGITSVFISNADTQKALPFYDKSIYVRRVKELT